MGLNFFDYFLYWSLNLKWSLFLAVPLASGQVHSSTSGVCHSLTAWLTDCLTAWLTAWVRKLKISVNINARYLNFGMSHPLAYWIRLRKNQLQGPYDGHIWATKGLFLDISGKEGPQDTPSNGYISVLKKILNFMPNASFCVLNVSLLLCYMLSLNSILPISKTIYIYYWYNVYFCAKPFQQCCW